MSVVLTDCRFCSEVSKMQKEDPIGTAASIDYWLLTEISQPWTEKVLLENPVFQPIIKQFRELILAKGIKLRPLAIAPDREYSIKDYTRVLFLERNGDSFASYKKSDYLIPTTNLGNLLQTIVDRLKGNDKDFSNFDKYLQPTADLREILVCTHGNVDVACARYGLPIYEELRQKYTDRPLRVWRCSHFGGHKFAPTLVDLPTGHYWGHLEVEKLPLLIDRVGHPTDLRLNYRGWSGLTKFSQILEREALILEGWEWLNYHKKAYIEAQDQGDWLNQIAGLLEKIPLPALKLFLHNFHKEPAWAEVVLEFTKPDGAKGKYQGRVERSGEVLTAGKSPPKGETIELRSVPQYKVENLQKLPSFIKM